VSCGLYTDVASINAQANLEMTLARVIQALARLSSGLRSNTTRNDTLSTNRAPDSANLPTFSLLDEKGIAALAVANTLIVRVGWPFGRRRAKGSRGNKRPPAIQEDS
jgi:hypothetical protein